MKRMTILCLVVAMVLCGSAFGAYKETFTGGFDLGLNPLFGGWQFQGLDISANPISGGFANNTSGNYLRTTAPFPPAGMGGTGAARVVGVVPAQPGTDFYMSAVFNPGQGMYPEMINDSCNALLARANPNAGTAYGVVWQRGWGSFRMLKVDPSLENGYADLGEDVCVTSGGYTLADTYSVDFRVVGNTISFSVFDAAGNYIGGDSVVDSDITGMGFSGVLAYLNPNSNPVIPGTDPAVPNPYYTAGPGGTEIPSPMNTTIDDIFMTGALGDVNYDGRVDFADFSVLQNHYGSVSGGWQQGDLNGDHQITFEDFAILQNHYGSGGMVASVPEPLTLTLLGLGGLFLARRK